jgi:hypothetical protein
MALAPGLEVRPVGAVGPQCSGRLGGPDELLCPRDQGGHLGRRGIRASSDLSGDLQEDGRRCSLLRTGGLESTI